MDKAINKEKDTEVKKSRKELIKDIVIWCITGIIVLFVVYGLVLKFTHNDVYLFGLRADVVTRDSMSYKNEDPIVQEFLQGHNDQIQIGDMTFSVKIDKKTELNVYDIVIFKNLQLGGALTTHRIVRIYQDDRNETRFVLRADTANHESYDGAYTRDYLVAKVVGIAAGIGHVFSFLTSIFGMILMAGLILIIFISDYLIGVNKNKEKAVIGNAPPQQIDASTESKDENKSEEKKEESEEKKEENSENSEDKKEEKEETSNNEESDKKTENDQSEESESKSESKQ